LAESRSLGDIGEHAFLARLCARLRERAELRSGVLVGPGDDCAVIDAPTYPLALTTDALVENVHFRRDWLTAGELGRRSVEVNLSDLAAMGATPTYTLVAVGAPPDVPADYVDELLDGCVAATEAAGGVLLGGNLTRGEGLSITVFAIGRHEGAYMTRGGALPGDLLVVTGTLGGAAAAVDAWQRGDRPAPALRERFVAPKARLAAGRAFANAGAHAAIDVSDGFLADLEHLCRASRVGAVVERERLPRLPEVGALDASGEDFAATGGEDYELLLACPPELESRLVQLAALCDVTLAVVGRLTPAEEGIVLLDASGAPHHPRRAAGHDHFRAGESRGGA
jgi:thiamine-monophosphate kinase